MNFREPNEDLFEETRMSFGEHLEELRQTLFKCMIWLAIGCAIGFCFANQVIRVLKKPLVDAVGEYRLADAADTILARDQYLSPELVPWLEKEKFLPRQMRVDPAQLVAALQTVVPEFASTVEIRPYRFRDTDFMEGRVPRLCKQLVGASQFDSASDAAESSDAVELMARSKAIWQALTADEKKTIQQIAGQSEQHPDDSHAIVELLNRVAGESKLYDSDAFSSEVTQEDTWFARWLGETKVKPLASMKSLVVEQGDPILARRLNRALIHLTFSKQMAPLKMELVPIELWESSEYEPQSLGVSETFMVWVKAGVLTGLVVAFPFIFYHLWTFVAAGLYPHEQKYVHIFLPISIALFVAGVLLAFFFVFQPVLGFLFSFNRQMGISPEMRINYWLSFVMFLPLGFGLAFQLPLVMLFMNRIGLFAVGDYLSKWRIAIMIIFVLAMLLTPADPISMLLLAIPLTLLYFLGIVMCQWMPRNQNPFGEPEREYVT